MTKKYLYFQPEYVREFVCDGLKCPHNCCERNWGIYVDTETYARYEQIRPEIKAREITACFSYDADRGEYFLKDRPCPFLTDKKLCRLQLEYGENFLSQVCKTFPRFTFDFGKFFERSLSLSCPVAAEMILFRDEPMTFELIELWEESTAKVVILPSTVPQKFVAHFVDLQIAMISILQERTLSIDQRLIVLGFFLDRLDEIIADGLDDESLTKLIVAYESKIFLSEQVPLMLATVQFDAKKFIGRILTILENLYRAGVPDYSKKSLDALIGTFEIIPDSSGKVSVTKIAANYERFADERKNFQARYSTFLENFLVNEMFLTCFPWKFKESIAKNFGVFVAEYKIFELLAFSAVQKNLGNRTELLELVDWFATQKDHNNVFGKKFLESLPDDIFSSIETFLEAT